MKTQKLQRKWSILLLALFFVAITCNNGLSTNAKTVNKIPRKMDPGTVIQYDKDGKMQIIEEGLKPTKELTVQIEHQIEIEQENLRKYPISEDAIYLPEIQPNLTVFYDGMGIPSVIRLNGDTLKSDGTPIVNTASINSVCSSSPPGSTMNSLSLSSNPVVFNGNITWYNGVGKMGSDGKILTVKDCATKIGLDEPPAGTQIYLYKNPSGVISDILNKYDVGTLPTAVLDISKNEMTNVFQVPAGVTSGGIAYGSFSGYYGHF
jgi:hypothetical protein